MPQVLRVRDLAAGALLLALTVTLLTLRLLLPPAQLFDIGTSGDAYPTVNFYQAEQAGPASFRWSGPNSALQLPGLVAQAVILSVRLHGNEAVQAVYFQSPETPVPLAVLSAGEGWRVYRVLIPPIPVAGAPRTLRLVANLVQPGAGDPRELGVALDWVHIQPLPEGAELLAAARQPVLLGWLLALIGTALWLVRRAWAPEESAATRGSRTVALLGIAAGALLWWAWQAPYSLGWLLPLQPAPLGAATAMLVGLGLAAHRPAFTRRLRNLFQGATVTCWLRSLSYGPAFTRLCGASRVEALAAAALLIVALLTLWSPTPAAWRGSAALLILWTPGWLLARWLTLREPDRAARLVLGVCGALCLQILLLLATALLPPGLTARALLLACALLALMGALLLWHAPVSPLRAQREGPRLGLLLALILVLAAGLRLPFLGSAELHDDEASVFIAAAQFVQGNDDVLLTQLKGPAQIVLSAGPLALTGQLTELAARLPFALAGLGVVAGGFVLARALAGGSAVAGLIAALILSLDGFMIAFSRIVQYQSVVVLLVFGALWCAWRFAEGGERPRALLAGTAMLFATALLGHYDAVFAAPALAWLVLGGGRRRGWNLAQWAKQLAWPVLAGGALLAGFYVPFVLHPHFAEVVAHLSERTGQTVGGWALYNNLPSSYTLLAFYNFAGLLPLLGVLLLGGLIAALANRRQVRWQAVAPLLLWCGAGGVATLFLIAQPRTHVYVFTTPLAILAGWCGAQLATWLSRPQTRSVRLPLAGAVLLVGLLALLHQATLYVRQNPEYQRAYPATALPPLAVDTTSVPIDGDARFGFPSRDGWKAIGELYRLGVLHGPYASNQSTEILTWYLRGLRRCGATPDYVFVALSAPNAAVPAGYSRFGSVQVAGRDQIAIYSRLPQGAPRVFALETYVAAFDAQPVPPLLPASVMCESEP